MSTLYRCMSTMKPVKCLDLEYLQEAMKAKASKGKFPILERRQKRQGAENTRCNRNQRLVLRGAVRSESYTLSSQIVVDQTLPTRVASEGFHSGCGLCSLSNRSQLSLLGQLSGMVDGRLDAFLRQSPQSFRRLFLLL